MSDARRAVVFTHGMPFAEFKQAVHNINLGVESPAELALASAVWLAASDVAEEDRTTVVVTTQADLSARGLPYRADFLLEAASGRRVVVEADGFAFHSDQWAFANDRKRDRAMACAGFTVLRFTAIEAMKEERECSFSDPLCDQIKTALRGA